MRRESEGAGKGRRLNLALGVCMIGLALAGCGSDGGGPAAADGGPGNPPQVSGVVLVTPDQVAAGPPAGSLAWLASLPFGPAQARPTGLIPLPEAQVELFRAGETADVLGPPVRSTSTNESGQYTFDDLPGEGLLIVRATGRTQTLRAFVSGARVDVTPVSELAVRRVGAALDDAIPLSHFSRPELAALSGYLQGLSIEASGLELEQAIEALDATAGTPFSDLLTAYAGPGMETSLRAGSYGAVEFTATLRDPALLEAEGLAGGLDLASGLGVIAFDAEADLADPAFVPREVFLQEFGAAPRDAAIDGQDLAPGTDLSGLLHVPGASGQLVVTDALRSGGAAGIGAVTIGGGLMVYPLVLERDRDAAAAAWGAGLRFAARRTEPAAAETNTLLDPLGGDATPYHLMRLHQGFAGGAESASVTIGAGSGTMVFDSAAQSHLFPGDAAAREYGSFSGSPGRNAVTLGLDDYLVSGADPGAAAQAGLYYVVPGTGLVEFRRNDTEGTRLGSGVLSADGEIVALQTAVADGPGGTMERYFAVAIRQQAGTEAPRLAGVYNLVQYTAYLSGDGEEPPQTAFLASGLRHGTLRLDAEGGLIDEGRLFDRRADLDVAAARLGEAGAIARSPASEMPATGTFRVDANGGVRLELSIALEDGGTETLTGTGAASAAGDFVALAVRSAGEGLGSGRGMLFLLRQGPAE